MLDRYGSQLGRSRHAAVRRFIGKILNGEDVAPAQSPDAAAGLLADPLPTEPEIAAAPFPPPPVSNEDAGQGQAFDDLLLLLQSHDAADIPEVAVTQLTALATSDRSSIDPGRLVEALQGAEPASVVSLLGPLMPLLEDRSVLALTLARASLAVGDGDGAESWLAYADPERFAFDAVRINANLHFFRGDDAAGIVLLAIAGQDGFEDAHDLASGRADDLLELAGSTDTAEDWHRAADALAAVARCWPQRTDAALEAARCYRKAGSPEHAIDIYRHVGDPMATTEAALALADTLLDLGDRDEAVRQLRLAAQGGSAIVLRRLHDLLRDDPIARSLPRRSTQMAMPPIDGGVAERSLLNRLTSKTELRNLIGSLDRGTHVPATEFGFGDAQSVRFDQAGWIEMLHEGRREPLLVGVVSIRGRILSDRALSTVDLIFRDEVVIADDMLSFVRHTGGRSLYAFNIWFDASRLGPARGELSVWARNDKGETLTAAIVVNITHTPAGLDLAASDSFVASPENWDDVEADVLARPPLVRPSLRPPVAGDVREVLAMRVDQLGDLSATLPAIRRLREIFPDARLTALVSASLQDIVAATGLCDEILGISLVYDHVSERRYLPVSEQARLKSAFDRHDFDIAIDFCPADETRAILKLVNARFLAGFNPREFQYLDFGVDIFTRDKLNQASIISHSAYVSVLVEALAVAMRPTQGIVTRQCDDTDALNAFGLQPGEYIVIHSGARHEINCWPLARFIELAERIACEFGHRVFFFADDGDMSWQGDPRITMAGPMPINLFDAVIANARLMVGNDSGPKHLAAVHGVRTVSVHVNRLNWREWGQDGKGVIITKKVPCCGCGLNNLAMCAKNAVCVTSIAVDDVFDAVVEQLSCHASEISADAAV